MARTAIVDKLRTILAGDIDSECKIVYILAESRKLFPRYKPVPFALNLYCHWALHVDLSAPRTTREFLEQVDGFVASVLQGSRDVRAENSALNHFVMMETFREQFRGFLNAFELPTPVCDEDRRWHEFVKHYCGVIEDGSLACQGENLQIVDKVIFSKGQRRPYAGSYMPFDLVWEIFLLDKRRIIVESNASPLPNGEPMRAWGIRIVG